mmetsp:Transcript_65819/g.189772  ORF Transcript_65819/g.189772 Transcript_65819/m.189772 type:complete len:253 (+) Transcript_65819:92-850(+)
MLSSIVRPALVAMCALPAAFCSSWVGGDGDVVAKQEMEKLAELLLSEGEAAGVRELAETSDSNATKATTQAATQAATTPPPGAAVEIKGSISMKVADPKAFAEDPKVKTAIGKSIGETIGVPAEYITVTLTVVTRRLDSSARRLEGSVTADYTITIPATAAATTMTTNPADITSKMTAVPVADLAKKITDTVKADGGTAYTVEVTAVATPTVAVVTTTAPATTVLPAAVSFAKTHGAEGLFIGLLMSMVFAQ